MKQTHQHALPLLFLSFLVIIVYFNSLNNAFLSDDLAEIVQKPEIANFSRVFQFPFGPIRHIIYWAAFHIGGLNPAIFRLTNILLHLCNTILVYLLLLKISKSKKISLFTSSIFAVHPAISEAVIWISGGMYPQYTLFFLVSFLFYISSKQKVKYYYFSVISYLFSFMSHYVMPAGLVIIFPLYELCFGNLKENWKKTIPYLIILIVYIIFNLNVLPQRQTTLQSTHYQQEGIDNPLVLIPIALTSYFELTLFPAVLTLYHSELSFGPINFTIRALVTLIFLGGILYSFKKSKFVFFWSSFFLLALSPTLTPFRLNWIVAERYLYLPIIGILAAVALGFDKLISLPKFRQVSLILFIVILFLLSLRTIIRNIDWANEDNLWIATGKTSPSSPNTHNNLGDVYGRKGDKLAALREFQKAIELKPDYGDAYHNLANTYKELGQTDKALENYQNALKYNPNLWQSYQNIGAIYFEQKKYDLALLNFQKAAQINPKNLSIQNAIGIIYLNIGDKNKAREIFNQLLNIDPNNQMLKQELLETNK